MRYIFCLFILSNLFFTTASFAQDGRMLDSLELVKFYAATDGANWDEPWDLSLPMETWNDITLNEEGRVMGIGLISGGLKGELIDFDLPYLSFYFCSFNDIEGIIPDFSKLPRLKTLSIVFNKLEGGIPNFSSLPLLENFDCSNNNLSGSIPDFTNLPFLEKFECESNSLIGSIPDFSSLPNLEKFSFYLNKLEGEIPDFSNLPNLKQLWCFGNNLSGELIDFSNLPVLEIYSVSSNNFTGKIPDFENLPALRNFSCHHNNLEGEIPNFSKIPLLEDFTCYNNELIGSIPDFSNTPLLEIFICDDNNLTGTIRKFSNTPNLILYSCGNNNLEGTIPNFTDFPELEYFTCDSANIIGQMPDFKNTPNLRWVEIQGNNLTSFHPGFATEHPSIDRFYLGDNEFTFENLLPVLSNIPIADSLNYIPQKHFFVDTTILASPNTSFTINLEIDASVASNIYTWYKNETLYQTIEGNNTITFPNIQDTDAGIYTVEVTNPNLPDLTLYSRSITIQVNPAVSMEAANLSAAETEGAPNETINLPILLSDVSTLATLEGEVQLSNANIGSIIGIENKAIDNVVFNAASGKFSWFDGTGEGQLLTNDTLFCLQIALTGEQGDSSLINLTDVKIWTFDNNQFAERTVTTENGKVKILANFALVGSIQNYQDKGINETTIKLESDYQSVSKIDTTYSILDGSYQLNQVRVGSNLVIEPFKEGAIGNGLSSAALFLAQRYLLGFEVPNINSPFQLAAGDANCDGRMSIVDLFLIQRAIVGIDATFSNCPNWKFVPTSEKDNFRMDANNYYPNYPFPMKAARDNQRTPTAIDFIGMKTGDILNRADLSQLRRKPIGAARTSLGQPPLKFYFAKQQAITGDTLCMDLNVTEFQNIGSIQFSMDWDTSKLQLLTATSILADANINSNNAIDGIIALSWFDIEGKGVSLPDSTALLTLCFVAIDDSDGTVISIANEPTPIEIAQFDGISVSILEVETTSTEVTIIPCDPINLGEDVVLCPNSTQILDAITLGGATFDWFRNGTAIFSADSIGTFEIADAGSYQVKKKIAANCILQDTIEVAIAPINQTVQEKFICGIVGARMDTLFLTSQKGCDSMVVIRNIPALKDTILETTFTCSPQDTGMITSLYTNISGCDSLVIQQVLLEPFTTDFTVSTINDNCQVNTSQIIITANHSMNSPYIYSIDNGATFTTDSIFSNIPNGDYQIIIENVQGCQQQLITTIQAPTINLELSGKVKLLLGDSLQLNPLLSNAVNAVINWSPSTGLSCTDCLNPIIKPIQSTNYKLSVTTQAGCMLEKEILVRINDQLNLFVPNIFSPNGDGQNDQLSIFAGLGIAQIEAFQVFDRWGALIYQANQVAEVIHWDGTVNGQAASSGTYIWALQLLKDNGKQVFKQGTVNLVR